MYTRDARGLRALTELAPVTARAECGRSRCPTRVLRIAPGLADPAVCRTVLHQGVLMCRCCHKLSTTDSAGPRVAGQGCWRRGLRNAAGIQVLCNLIHSFASSSRCTHSLVSGHEQQVRRSPL
jgi:hypothetical protein